MVCKPQVTRGRSKTAVTCQTSHVNTRLQACTLQKMQIGENEEGCVLKVALGSLARMRGLLNAILPFSNLSFFSASLSPFVPSLSDVSFVELFLFNFLTSAEQFGFHRASPACGEMGQPRRRSRSPRGEVSAMCGVRPWTSLFSRLSLSSFYSIFFCFRRAVWVPPRLPSVR